MVKVITARKFMAGNEQVFVVDPEFEMIEYFPPGEQELAGVAGACSEEYHLVPLRYKGFH
jgi:hypothetical protein